jgi:hypothetical protein
MLMNGINIHITSIGGRSAGWQPCARLSSEMYGLGSFALDRFAVGGILPAQPEARKGQTIKNRRHIQV